MKKSFLLVLFLLLSFSSFSQLGGEDEVYLSGDRIDPVFNGGGFDVFYQYISKNFDFSKVKSKGTIVASFTIAETGELKNIKVIRFLDIESATEIIRVLKAAPKWKPAMKNGKPISVDLKIPLNFK